MTFFLSTRIIPRAHHQLWHTFFFFRFSSNIAEFPRNPLEESIKLAVYKKTYEELPQLLTSLEESCKRNNNPFSFLSSFTLTQRTQIVDEILQSFISFKPHFRLRTTFHYLLTYTLESSHPFPLSLITLQRTLRSGCTPFPQTHLTLASAWVCREGETGSVHTTLLGMKRIGYYPDTGTCNFVIKSLCAVDQLEEAVDVLRGMTVASCVPDSDSYCTIIAALCGLRKTDKALELIKEMTNKLRLSPTQGILVRLVASLRANKEIRRAVDIIKFLEKKGFHVGFESFELLVEGCLERDEFILAGKMAMLMAEKGYIPYIKVRQKVVEGLVGVGEWKLACAVRHRFAEMNS